MLSKLWISVGRQATDIICLCKGENSVSTSEKCCPRELKWTEYKTPTPTGILFPLGWFGRHFSCGDIKSHCCRISKWCPPHQYIALQKWWVYIVNVSAVPRLEGKLGCCPTISIDISQYTIASFWLCLHLNTFFWGWSGTLLLSNTLDLIPFH